MAQSQLAIAAASVWSGTPAEEMSKRERTVALKTGVPLAK